MNGIVVVSTQELCRFIKLKCHPGLSTDEIGGVFDIISSEWAPGEVNSVTSFH